MTFLDVLGWKGIYGRHEDPLGSIASLLNDLQRLSEQAGRGVGTVGLPTKVISISDTIVLYTACEGAHVSEALKIQGRLCCHAVPASIRSSIPMRGATSYGQAAVADGGAVYMGPAVDEAAAWHEQGNWIGVHLTPSAQFSAGPDHDGWVKYDVPLKTGGKLSTLVADWAMEVPTAMSHFAQMAPILPATVAKYTNTISFLERPGP